MKSKESMHSENALRFALHFWGYENLNYGK